MEGLSFGKWLVVRRSETKAKDGAILYLCRCSCGTEKLVVKRSLTNGLSKSCGCSGKEWCKTHGLSKTPEYVTWAAMLQRCNNPKNKWYQHYGGRGIKVCERWCSFEAFYADMGPRPDGATLDRYPNNDGDYEPSNCRWATQTQQIRNRSVTKMLVFCGDSKPLAEWAEVVGLPRKIVKDRLAAGWSVEDALTRPMRDDMTHCRRGHEYTPANLAHGKSGEKICRECSRLKTAAWRGRKKQQAS